MTRFRTLSALCLLGVVGASLVSCSARPAPVELTFASSTAISPEMQRFVDEIEADKTITVTVVADWSPKGAKRGSTDDEASLAQAVAADEVDLAWSSTRVFPALGVNGFRAVEAPMLITSYAAERDIVSGDTGAAIKGGLNGTGVTALALFPGALRYPLTNGRPLLDPADWSGKRIATVQTAAGDSVQARTATALGGTPVDQGRHLVDDLKAGVIDGASASLGDVAAGGTTTSGPFLTGNVVLWPTLNMIVANSDSLGHLTQSQQATITLAALHLRADLMSVTPDPAAIASICSATKVGVATAQQRSALRAAVQPVYDWLEGDAVEAPFLHTLQAIAAAHPDADIPAVPAGCAWAP